MQVHQIEDIQERQQSRDDPRHRQRQLRRTTRHAPLVTKLNFKKREIFKQERLIFFLYHLKVPIGVIEWICHFS